MNKLLGIDYANQPDKTVYTLISINKIQNKKHRKKRINKKWGKRYGFTDVQTVLDNVIFNTI